MIIKTFIILFLSGLGALGLDRLHQKIERIMPVKECAVCHKRYDATAVYCCRDASLLQFRTSSMRYIERQGINRELLEKIPRLQEQLHANDGE